MKIEVIDRLLVIAGAGLLLGGLIFLGLSIFTEPKNSTYLCIALGSITLANLFLLLRNRRSRQK